MSIQKNIEHFKSVIPSNVELVAVSKFHPCESIIQAYEAGQRIFAESRPQELAKKALELTKEQYPDLKWHFIGHLQTNKLKMVLPVASLIESVDSVHLLDEIQKWATANKTTIKVLLEVHVAAEESKQGLYEEEVLEILFNKEKYSNIVFKGLMGMATNTDDTEIIRADFQRLDALMAYLKDLFPEMQEFDQLSMGMSSDWELAVENGSTMVRIGTAIFGQRS